MLAGGKDVAIEGSKLVHLWQAFQKSYNEHFAGKPGFTARINKCGFADRDSLLAAEQVEGYYRDKYAHKAADALLRRYQQQNAAHPLGTGTLNEKEIKDGVVYMYARGVDADPYLEGVVLGVLPDNKRDAFLEKKDQHAAIRELIGGNGPVTNDERVRLWQQFQKDYNIAFKGKPDFHELNEYGYADANTQNAAWLVSQLYNERYKEREAAKPGHSAISVILTDSLSHMLDSYKELMGGASPAGDSAPHPGHSVPPNSAGAQKQGAQTPGSN